MEMDVRARQASNGRDRLVGNPAQQCSQRWGMRGKGKILETSVGSGFRVGRSDLYEAGQTFIASETNEVRAWA